MLSHCRYYRGEAECPLSDANERVLWTIEREWATLPATEGTIPPVIEQAMTAYFDAGLSVYRIDDETPISLKAYLFLRLKGTAAPITPEVVSRFKAVYERYY